MINRFALSFLCIELDRDKTCGVTLVYILLTARRFVLVLIALPLAKISS